jgi:stage IV sporulation protein FB
MIRSYKIFSAAGTDVYLHPSIAIIGAFIMLPSLGDGFGELAKSAGIFTILFLSIILHEFGHVLAARKMNIPTGDVNLNMLGGLANINITNLRPMQEFKIAIAGPFVNLCILMFVFLLVYLIDPAQGTRVYDLLLVAGAVNGVMMIFNLLPIFPMDGGRISRSIMSGIWGHVAGTRFAIYLGWSLSLIMMVYAVQSMNIILMGILVFTSLSGYIELQRLKPRPEDIPETTSRQS